MTPRILICAWAIGASSATISSGNPSGARFTGSGWLRESHIMLLAVAPERGFADVETMNDKSSHGQVLSAFGEAIARARLRAA